MIHTLLLVSVFPLQGGLIQQNIRIGGTLGVPDPRGSLSNPGVSVSPLLTGSLALVPSRDETIQTITLQSTDKYPAVEVTPSFAMSFTWLAAHLDPVRLFVTVEVEERLAGPVGSAATIGPSMRNGALAASGIEACELPSLSAVVAGRPSGEAVMRRTFELPALTGPKGHRFADLNFALGRLSVRGGGKVQFKFTVVSLSEKAPAAAP